MSGERTLFAHLLVEHQRLIPLEVNCYNLVARQSSVPLFVKHVQNLRLTARKQKKFQGLLIAHCG